MTWSSSLIMLKPIWDPESTTWNLCIWCLLCRQRSIRGVPFLLSVLVNVWPKKGTHVNIVFKQMDLSFRIHASIHSWKVSLGLNGESWRQENSSLAPNSWLPLRNATATGCFSEPYEKWFMMSKLNNSTNFSHWDGGGASWNWLTVSNSGRGPRL